MPVERGRFSFKGVNRIDCQFLRREVETGSRSQKVSADREIVSRLQQRESKLTEGVWFRIGISNYSKKS
jgi:hypothetical protein